MSRVLCYFTLLLAHREDGHLIARVVTETNSLCLFIGVCRKMGLNASDREETDTCPRDMEFFYHDRSVLIARVSSSNTGIGFRPQLRGEAHAQDTSRQDVIC